MIPIIGQNNTPGEDRVREFTVAFTNADGQRQAERVNTRDFTEHGRRDWVIPTGGGYFFAPSIDALRDVLTRKEEENRIPDDDSIATSHRSED